MFITLDQSVPLKTVVSDLCKSWMITDPADQYALQFSDDDVSKNDSRSIIKTGDGRYVTEKNRTEIRNGSILQFSHSPSRITNDIIDVLTKKSKDQMKTSLQQLVRLSADPAFAAEFIQKKGRKTLAEALEQRSIKPDDGLGSALEAFNKLMDWEAWDKPSHKFISVIANEINQPEDSTATDPKILINALSILESAAISGVSFYSVVESELSLPKLIHHVQRQTGQPEIQMNAIALINALILKADIAKKKSMIMTLSNQRFRSIITSCILDLKHEVGSEMAHQLYALQTALFSIYDEDISSSSKEKIDESINELRKLAFEGDFGASDVLNRSRASNAGSLASSSFHSLQDDYQKLGFSNCKNPVEDFSEFPRLLSLNLMLYFARNYTEHFVKFVLENCCRVDRDHECPFVRSSIELTKLICDLLKLTNPPSDEGKLFYPMFFTHEHPLEEFFVISLLTLNKTWKEMRATTEDFGKVFSVLQQQLSRSLKDRDATVNFEKLKNNLHKLNYAEIMKLWQEERSNREEWENKAQSILELREVVKPSIVMLIQRQRLRFLTEGTQFVKYSPKGM
jgi:engulfment/cell motility protein 1